MQKIKLLHNKLHGGSTKFDEGKFRQYMKLKGGEIAKHKKQMEEELSKVKNLNIGKLQREVKASHFLPFVDGKCE